MGKSLLSAVCDCDEVGTVEGTVCNHSTGQCECHENITGLRCDRCQPATYGLRTLGACPGCDCCLPGAASVNCTQVSGRVLPLSVLHAFRGFL